MLVAGLIWINGWESGGWGGEHAPWQDTCRQCVFRASHRRGGTSTHDGTSRFASFACLPLTRTLRSSFTSPPPSHSRGPRRVYCQVYAILGTNFFSHRTPEHFSNFHTSLFTMFQVMSGGASVYRVRACVLLCKRVARALFCGTHTPACAVRSGPRERAGRARAQRGRVNARAWGRVITCARAREHLRRATHTEAHTGSCRLVGKRRGTWNLRSVHARTVGSLPSSLSLFLLFTRWINLSAQTLCDSAPGQTDADVAFFFVSFFLIESIMLLNVSMHGRATVCRA